MSYNHQPGPPLGKRLIFSLVRLLLHNPIGNYLAGSARFIYPRHSKNWATISNISLELPRLDAQFRGYRIAQISDFHYGTWLSRPMLEQVVMRINAQKPDLVAITGDIVTFDPARFADDLVSVLGEIQAKDGVVAVMGNHDHWSDPVAVRDLLQKANVRTLDNDVMTLQRDGALLHICGIDDFMNGHDRLEQVDSKLPAKGAAILLAHEPDFADHSAENGRFDLQISGHSHGGQIVFPIFGALYLPAYARKYTSGLYHVKGMLQYTNRGLGTAELQFRLNCPPEITIFELNPVTNHTKTDSF
jgi:hypothetical protein